MCSQEAWGTTLVVSEPNVLDMSEKEINGVLIYSFIQNYHCICLMDM